MAKFAFREEVINVALAEILEQRGMLSVPETIRKTVRPRARNLPDIIVGDLFGVRIVIEGRFDNGRPSHESLLKDAKERVERGISPVCLAVLYPLELRSANSLPELKRNLEKATFRIRVISENSEGDWTEGTVNDIADALRRSYELLVGEDVVATSVGDIEDAIDAASEVFVRIRSLKERFRQTLGIPADSEETSEEDEG